ncbi:MAG: hypothetical protein JXB88_01685 [Spirochaetales bacterium]|nr:hypothetical protein [Spirochaetales bacterium]
MNKLHDILKSKRMNDKRGIHKTLRQIDTKILALALFGLSDKEREPIFRNMTNRSREIIEKEFTLIQKSKHYIYPQEAITREEAQDLLSELILTNTIDTYETETVYPQKLPHVDLSTSEKIVETFDEIANHSYEYGLGSLEGLEKESGNMLFEKSIQLLLDGYEPLLFEQILENYKERMLHSYETKLSLIIEGVKCLQMGWPPAAIKEKMISLCYYG